MGIRWRVKTGNLSVLFTTVSPAPGRMLSRLPVNTGQNNRRKNQIFWVLQNIMFMPVANRKYIGGRSGIPLWTAVGQIKGF